VTHLLFTGVHQLQSTQARQQHCKLNATAQKKMTANTLKMGFARKDKNNDVLFWEVFCQQDTNKKKWHIT